MNDDELEERLGQWHPADPPRDLMQRLRAAEPLLPPPARALWLRPWPLAYAGLAAVWMTIFVLRLMTAPLLPPSVDSDRSSDAFTGGPAADQMFLLARNSPEEFWP